MKQSRCADAARIISEEQEGRDDGDPSRPPTAPLTPSWRGSDAAPRSTRAEGRAHDSYSDDASGWPSPGCPGCPRRRGPRRGAPSSGAGRSGRAGLRRGRGPDAVLGAGGRAVGGRLGGEQELLQGLLRRVRLEDRVLDLQLVDAVHQLGDLVLEHFHLLADGEHEVALDQVHGLLYLVVDGDRAGARSIGPGAPAHEDVLRRGGDGAVVAEGPAPRAAPHGRHSPGRAEARG